VGESATADGLLAAIGAGDVRALEALYSRYGSLAFALAARITGSRETAEEVVYLEVGDRTSGDQGCYPDDDLQAAFVDGQWRFTRKDGTPYP